MDGCLIHVTNLTKQNKTWLLSLVEDLKENGENSDVRQKNKIILVTQNGFKFSIYITDALH